MQMQLTSLEGKESTAFKTVDSQKNLVGITSFWHTLKDMM
jgi:hypothetical protein